MIFATWIGAYIVNNWKIFFLIAGDRIYLLYYSVLKSVENALSVFKSRKINFSKFVEQGYCHSKAFSQKYLNLFQHRPHRLTFLLINIPPLTFPPCPSQILKSLSYLVRNAIRQILNLFQSCFTFHFSQNCISGKPLKMINKPKHFKLRN